MLNQAAVEALCSATYLENYLDCMDNLPDDLQRSVSSLRELDSQTTGRFYFQNPNVFTVSVMHYILARKVTEPEPSEGIFLCMPIVYGHCMLVAFWNVIVEFTSFFL